MSRFPRLLATIAVTAAALTVSPLSSSLVGTASAATASITTVGTWVYPGKLVVKTTGSPEAPYAAGTHSASWVVFALAPSQPCPSTFDAVEDLQASGQIEVAEGSPTGTSFAHTDTVQEGTLPYDKPLHLCGAVEEVEAGSYDPATGVLVPTSHEVTASSDTPLAPAATSSGIAVSGGYARHYVIATCADLWPNGKVQWLDECNQVGKVVEKVSERVQNKLGIPSRLIGKATIAPSSNGPFRTYLTISKAVQKAFPKWYDHEYPAKITVTVTSPVPMSKTQTVHGPSEPFALFSWK